MELDPQVSVRIRSAAADCNRLKAIMEHTKDPERLKDLQRQYDEAEQRMVQVSLEINRGISRPPPG